MIRMRAIIITIRIKGKKGKHKNTINNGKKKTHDIDKK